MSSRHHQLSMPVTDPELAAHNRAERQRVRVQLSRMNADFIEEIDEPGVAYRAPHRHDPEIAAKQSDRPYVPHWKQPFWKRRTTMRRLRIVQEQSLRNA